MIDLGRAPLVVAGRTLAPDASDPQRWFLLPDTARVARDADGAPRLRLWRFVRGGELVGGAFDLHVDFDVGAADVQAALVEAAGEGATVAGAPPVRAAAAELMLALRATDGGVLAPVSHARAVALSAPPFGVHFSLPLPPEAVPLFDAALRSRGAPLGVVGRLDVDCVRPGDRVLARLRWRRAYDHLSSHRRAGFLFSVAEIRELVERLVDERVVEISVIRGPTEGEPDDARLERALSLVQREIVERFFEPALPLDREPATASLGTVGEILGVGAAFALKDLTQLEEAEAVVDFQYPQVVVRTLTPQAHLADLLAGADPAAHVVDADTDHPFFERAWLELRAARPLAESHVAEVTGTWTYGDRALPLRLTAEQPQDRAETWADASPDGRWRLTAEATLRADAPVDAGRLVTLPAVEGTGRALTLALDRMLGLRAVVVEAGGGHPRLLGSRAHLRHRRAGALLAEQACLLTAAEPRATLWFRDWRDGDALDATAVHLLDDGRIVQSDPLAVETQVYRLPPPFPGAMTVQVRAADDWTGLRRALVALQALPDGPVGTVVLQRAGEVQAMALDLADPLDRRYRYRVTRERTDGPDEDTGWRESDRPLLLVAAYEGQTLVVDVRALGPELPTAGLHLIEVELQYLDPVNFVRANETALLRARSDTFRWEVPLADVTKRQYEYRVRRHRLLGGFEETPWTPTTDRLLVIPITP